MLKFLIKLILIIFFSSSNLIAETLEDIEIKGNQRISKETIIMLGNIKKNVDLTYEMKKFLLKGNLKELGKCLDKAWEFKKSFSTKITNKHLDKIYNGAKKNGALGGKLMGAGGGGYFLFFVMPKNRNKLISWIKRMDLGYTPFSFENKGLQSWSNRKI